MEAGIFLELSLILVIATAVSSVAQILRQPLIIGHIITGILLGPSVLNLLHSTETVELLARIGVALLLFIIGLGLNPLIIKEVGKVSLITGLGQITFTSTIGFFLARLLGFSLVPAVYIAVALTFSSTIIILKLLSDKREQSRLYGKIAIGFLLVQDIVAVAALILISGVATGTDGGSALLLTLFKGLAFAGGLIYFSAKLLPKLLEFFARSQEMLFIFSVGWGLGVAALGAALGFSIEIGALAAGVAIAPSVYSFEVSSRLKPLRDFFIVLFFIILGANMSFGNLGTAILPALALAVFVLIGNPIIIMSLMGLLGYTKKTSFKAGLTVAQISEFSLILVILGNQVGHVSAQIVAVITLVGIITIAGSTYLMLYDEKLFKKLEPLLNIFERHTLKDETVQTADYDAILFGYKVGGQGFLESIKKLGKNYLVVDYDPEIIDYLKSKKVSTRYGDANDIEFLQELNLAKTRLVVINVTDYSTNALITEHTKRLNPKAIIVALAQTDKSEEALDLYEKGANYVMMPRYLGNQKIANLLLRHPFDKAKLREERSRHKRWLAAAGG